MITHADNFEYLSTHRHGERLTIENRLYNRASNGALYADFGLYRNQEKRLVKNGFTVEHTGQNVDHNYPGQYKCRITWNLVVDQNSFAYYLYKVAMAARGKGGSIEPIPTSGKDFGSACPPPYSGGWEQP